jgi:hypothetical protein
MQPPDFVERGLLRFQMFAVASMPGAEHDVANTRALAPLVTERVAGSLTDCFAFPLAYGTHNGEDQESRGRAVVQRFGHRDVCDGTRAHEIRYREWKHHLS